MEKRGSGVLSQSSLLGGRVRKRESLVPFSSPYVRRLQNRKVSRRVLSLKTKRSKPRNYLGRTEPTDLCCLSFLLNPLLERHRPCWVTWDLFLVLRSEDGVFPPPLPFTHRSQDPKKPLDELVDRRQSEMSPVIPFDCVRLTYLRWLLISFFLRTTTS